MGMAVNLNRAVAGCGYVAKRKYHPKLRTLKNSESVPPVPFDSIRGTATLSQQRKDQAKYFIYQIRSPRFASHYSEII